LGNSVLGSLVHSGWSTLELNAYFLSATSFGMLLGTLMEGILGDLYGRKFSYQFNLAVFGLASLACALAPSMSWLIAARFLCGVGLGAELVVGYGMLGEFVPPTHRGRWAALLSCMAQFGLFGSTLLSWLIIPTVGWRGMFVVAGIGALVIYFARKVIPESPRWLESKGRTMTLICMECLLSLNFTGYIIAHRRRWCGGRPPHQRQAPGGVPERPLVHVA
jgi:putative MFS transporter